MQPGEVRVVLVEPQFPRNIGSAARAVKTMGLGSLWLVRPQQFPHRQATMMAAEAVDTLEQAQVVETLDEAITDCRLTIATSKRDRGVEWPTLDIDQTVETVRRGIGPAALVFGPEPSGLSNEQLFRCRYRSFLPTSEACTSLNLAQAVQIYGYALMRGLDTPAAAPTGEPLASEGALDAFHVHLNQVLEGLAFPRHHPEHLAVRFRALFNRNGLTDSDIRLLRGLLRRIEQRIRKP